MSDYIITEADHSGDESDVSEVIVSDHDEFIDDVTQDDEDIDVYRRVNKNILLGGDNPEPSNAIGRLRIDSKGSDDDGFHDDDVGVDNLEPPSDPDDDEIQIPEKDLGYYGTSLKEWNHYDKPKNSICDFKGDDHYLKNFLSTLYLPLKENAGLSKYLPMAKNFFW